jgi:raffinose/stachyose/melibiose transport system substrate-binding protein
MGEKRVDQFDKLAYSRLTRRTALQRAAGGLLVAGFAGGLAACGGSSTSSSSGTGTGTSSENTTITAWSEHPEIKGAIQELLDAFHEEFGSVAVEMSYKPPAQYESLLHTALVGGAAPDLLGFAGAASLQAGKTYAKPGGQKVDTSILTPVAKNAVVFDNHTWGCPLTAYSVGVFYQRPIFKEHGIEPPKTWDDLIAAAKKLQEAGITPIAMPAQDMIIPGVFYELAVASILGEEAVELLSTGQRKLTEPELVRAAQLMVDLQPYYNKGFVAVPYAEGKALFAQGQTAMIIGGSEDYTGYTELNPNVDVGVFGFPSPDGSKQVTVSGTDQVYTANKETPHFSQVEDFLGWLATKPAQQIVADKIAEPVVTGVRNNVGGDAGRVANEMHDAGNPNAIRWIENLACAGTFTAITESGGIFTGSLDAAGLAKNCQEAITVS